MILLKILNFNNNKMNFISKNLYFKLIVDFFLIVKNLLINFRMFIF